MSRTAHKLMASGAKEAYEIDQSLMFGEDANSYIYKNYGSAGTSRTTWTFSAWVKRTHAQTGHDDSNKGNILFSAWDDSTNTDTEYFALNFYADKIYIGGYNTNWRITNRLFRDTASWFHLCLAIDTTQSTANDRIKLYINGVQETSFSTTNNPTQNANTGVGSATWTLIGAINATGTVSWYKGYVAEVHYVDGTALTPSSFGETDSATGQWIPKKYSGSYGNNGVYLKLASGAIGTDSSGNGNTWSTSSMGNGDVMLDSPTNNFCTLNDLSKGSYTQLTQGSLRAKGAASSDSGWGHGTFLLEDGSGKWYYESRVEANYTGGATYPDAAWGVADSFDNTTTKNEPVKYILVREEGYVSHGGSTFTEQSGMDGTSFSTGDIFCMAIDMTNKKVWAGKNGTFFNSGDPVNGTNPTFTWTASIDIVPSTHNYYNSQQTLNFGQNGTFCGAITAGGNADTNGYGDFKHIPSGYKAMCTKNLSTPAVKKSTEHFNIVTYTGNGADNRGITGVGFQPDLTWIKTRSETQWPLLCDSVRGANKSIYPNSNYVEETLAETFESFDSDGFTVSYRSQSPITNKDTATYVAWNWKAGGSGSANTDGSINTTSTSVNTTAGFSISNYQGTGSNATVGHGLGVAPKTIWIKNRDTNDNWRIYFGDNTDYMAFNWTGGGTDDNTAWNDTSPTSTVFSIGTDTNTNRSGDDFIAYCFAEVDGFSRFGTYEGNNNANGPFIHTGFRPAWIVFKYMDNNDESWWMIDNKRDLLNPNTINLFVNLTNGDYDAGGVDILSNGFKPRATNGGLNGYTGTFFYMAFAEAPFKYANAQ